jgi:hypothetical protein
MNATARHSDEHAAGARIETEIEIVTGTVIARGETGRGRIETCIADELP